MAIHFHAPARRVRPSVALACLVMLLGVPLAWLLQPASPDAGAVPRAGPTETVRTPAAPADVPLASGCDARCVVAKVIVPATTACAAAVEELAGFGVRWRDAGAAAPKFDRFTWLQQARGTVTLAGDRAEFRNAAGAYLPVAYGCDFDPATLAVIEARVRPGSRPITPVARAGSAAP